MESLLHSNHSQPDRQVAQKLAFNVKDRESCFLTLNNKKTTIKIENYYGFY